MTVSLRGIGREALVIGALALLPAGCRTTGSALYQPRDISADLHCAVCGMHPAEQSRWQSQIIMGDGRRVVFDSGKELFRYLQLLNRDDHAGNQGWGLGQAAVWVRDYQSGNWLDGRAAWYVVGSAEAGPMGRDIIPWAGRRAAEAFRRQQGGQLADFAGIDAKLLNSLGK